MKTNIILASTSPRRIEILRTNGISPEIVPPEADETLPAGISMKTAVLYLALKKALSVERKREDGLIIAADTVVYLDRIIGKPSDFDEACSILKGLSGHEHIVATGVALIDAGTENRRIFCEVTKVFFKDYTDQEIEAYVRTGEPFDKAGGYAIQGQWGKNVDHIEGDFDNVVGFPWTRIHGELKDMGYQG